MHRKVRLTKGCAGHEKSAMLCRLFWSRCPWGDRWGKGKEDRAPALYILVTLSNCGGRNKGNFVRRVSPNLHDQRPPTTIIRRSHTLSGCVTGSVLFYRILYGTATIGHQRHRSVSRTTSVEQVTVILVACCSGTSGASWTTGGCWTTCAAATVIVVLTCLAVFVGV
jgi:hypothetical protein